MSLRWLLLCALLWAPSARAYEGGILKNHNHTTVPGDGGKLSNLDTAGYHRFDQSMPPACVAGKGTIYFDQATQKFKFCENAGSFNNLSGNSVTFVVVETATLSAASSYTFATAISTGSIYKVTYNLKQNTSASNLYLKGNDTASDYFWSVISLNEGTGLQQGGSNGTGTSCILTSVNSQGNGLTANSFVHGQIEIDSIFNSSVGWHADGIGNWSATTSDNEAHFNSGCWDNSTTVWNSLTLGTTAGTISGTVYLWQQQTAQGIGSQGPAGPAGPAGPQGPAGTSFYTLDHSTAPSSSTLGSVNLTNASYNSWNIHAHGIYSGSGAGTLTMRFNNDSSAVYDWNNMFFCAGTTAGSANTGDTSILISGITSGCSRLLHSGTSSFAINAIVTTVPGSTESGGNGSTWVEGTITYYSNQGQTQEDVFSARYTTATLTSMQIIGSDIYSGSISAVGFNQ